MNTFARQAGSEASTYQQEPLYTTEQLLLRQRLDQERRLWEHNEQVLKLQIQRRRTRKLQKISMFILSSLALVETIILVTTIVKPYPQFSLSGNLLYIQSENAEQYSKRATGLMIRDFAPLDLSRADRNLDEMAAEEDYTDQSRFVAFWLGTLGVCLQRASGAIICTGGLSKTFTPLYLQSRLPQSTTATLPSGTSGAPLGYLFGAPFILYLPTATSLAQYIWSPYPKGTSWEKQYQFIVGFCSIFLVGGVAAFIVVTIQLRNRFNGIAKAVPALNPDLIAKFDGGFRGLYASCIIGGLVVAGSVMLTYWLSTGEEPVQRPPVDHNVNLRIIGKIDAESRAASNFGGSSRAPNSSSEGSAAK